MKITEGYKQTDIGIIPGDWGCSKLGDFGIFSNGQGIKKDDVQTEGLPCIRYGEIYTKHNEYIKEFYSYISKDIAKPLLPFFRQNIIDPFPAGGATLSKEFMENKSRISSCY